MEQLQCAPDGLHKLIISSIFSYKKKEKEKKKKKKKEKKRKKEKEKEKKRKRINTSTVSCNNYTSTEHVQKMKRSQVVE